MQTRTLLSSLAIVVASLAARSAAAFPEALLDESRLGPRLDQIDGDPHELWVDSGEPIEGQPWTRTPKRRVSRASGGTAPPRSSSKPRSK